MGTLMAMLLKICSASAPSDRMDVIKAEPISGTKKPTTAKKKVKSFSVLFCTPEVDQHSTPARKVTLMLFKMVTMSDIMMGAMRPGTKPETRTTTSLSGPLNCFSANLRTTPAAMPRAARMIDHEAAIMNLMRSPVDALWSMISWSASAVSRAAHSTSRGSGAGATRHAFAMPNGAVAADVALAIESNTTTAAAVDLAVPVSARARSCLFRSNLARASFRCSSGDLDLTIDLIESKRVGVLFSSSSSGGEDGADAAAFSLASA
mmetsp:Transcript_11213/g.33626  ORF Transcript_11213/g.33626 Transcript_11213/m.33626 type:complete len:263 (+) Transcript_11213:2490-3278(+)